MSSIYVSEPATRGKVVLNTTLGPLDIEIWPKEAPKACQNFVQLSLEGFYNQCPFHRIIPYFIIQTGDPNGDGKNVTIFSSENEDGNGQSFPNATFPIEYHSRLHFSHRGLVATAGTPDDPERNASQFFITMGRTLELERKHTIFGKVVGDTIFNILKVNDMPLLEGYDDRLAYPPMIISAQVVWNPFDHLVPRQITFPHQEKEKEKKKANLKKAGNTQTKASKKRELLSFQEELDDKLDFSMRKPVNVSLNRVIKRIEKQGLSHPLRDQINNKIEVSYPVDKNGVVPTESREEYDEDQLWQLDLEKRNKEWKKVVRKDERKIARIMARQEDENQALMEEKVGLDKAGVKSHPTNYTAHFNDIQRVAEGIEGDNQTEKGRKLWKSFWKKQKQADTKEEMALESKESQLLSQLDSFRSKLANPKLSKTIQSHHLVFEKDEKQGSSNQQFRIGEKGEGKNEKSFGQKGEDDQFEVLDMRENKGYGRYTKYPTKEK